MSAHTEPKDPEQTSDTHSIHDELGIDHRYTIIPDGHVEGNTGKLSDAFIDMKYPLNRDNNLDEGVIRLTGRWQARQRPDGSGVVESKTGSQLYGTRLPNGEIIANDDTDFWFPYHSDYHQRRPDDSGEIRRYDYDWFIQIPFRFIAALAEEFTTIDNADPDSLIRLGSDPGEQVVEWNTLMRNIVGADILTHETEHGVLLTHESGVQFYAGYDSTAKEDNELFGFVPFDGNNGVPVPSASDALDLLRPGEAATAGSDVTRQGEWFFVPTDERPSGSIQRPGVGERPFGASPLGDHIPREWRCSVGDSVFLRRFYDATDNQFRPADYPDPQDCIELVHENDLDVTMADVREMAGGIFVRGTVRHREREHGIEKLDDWHRAVSHDWDAMTVDDLSAAHRARYVGD